MPAVSGHQRGVHAMRALLRCRVAQNRVPGWALTHQRDINAAAVTTTRSLSFCFLSTTAPRHAAQSQAAHGPSYLENGAVVRTARAGNNPVLPGMVCVVPSWRCLSSVAATAISVRSWVDSFSLPFLDSRQPARQPPPPTSCSLVGRGSASSVTRSARPEPPAPHSPPLFSNHSSQNPASLSVSHPYAPERAVRGPLRTHGQMDLQA